MDYKKLCSDIFKIDSKIRFAAVFDYWAECIAGGMREGLTNLLPDRVTKNSVNQALLRWKSRKTTEEWIGKTIYAMAEYEKVKRLTFYFNENELLLLTLEPDANHESIIKSTKQLIAENS